MFQGCHFYCNWESDFLDHWLSDIHKRTNNDEGEGDGEEEESMWWWCSFCDAMARGNDEALEVSACWKL